jgi:hypothetical protein
MSKDAHAERNSTKKKRQPNVMLIFSVAYFTVIVIQLTYERPKSNLDLAVV